MSSILEEVAAAFIEAYEEGGEDTMYAEQVAVDYLMDEYDYTEAAAKAYIKHNDKAITKIAFRDYK